MFNISCARTMARAAYPLAILALSLMTLASCYAADRLTLDQSVAEIGENSSELKLSEGRVEADQAKKSESLAAFLPTLGVNAYHLTNVKYQTFNVQGLGTDSLSVPVVVPQTSYKLTASILLFDGLRNVVRLRAAHARARSSEDAHRFKIFSLAQEVTQAFYQTLAAQLLAEVADQNIRTLEDHAAHVDARKKGGVATRYDTLRVEVQLDEAKTQKMLALDNVALERRKLARLMGVPNDEREVSGDLPEPRLKQNSSKLSASSAIDSRLDLVAYHEEEAASGLDQTAAQLWWSPQISAFTDYELYNNTNFNLGGEQNFRSAYDVGLALKWNIFDGGLALAKARENAALAKQASATLQRESDHVPEDLDRYQRRYTYGVALYQTATSDIQKSEESVRQAEAGFKQGVRTVSEQLDAQLDLFRSRASQVNAKLTAALAWIDLETTMGRKLNHE